MREKLSFPEGFLDEALPQGYFSSSQYNCYKKCGHQYELSYCKKLKLPPSAAMFKGQALHLGAETVLRFVKENGKIPPIELGKEAIVRLFSKSAEQEVVWDEEETEGKAKDDTIAAYYSYYMSLLPNLHPLEIEQCFIKRIGVVPTVGYIDLIDQVPCGKTFQGPLRNVICDLKYTKQTWSQDKLDKDPQFTLYSIATGIPFVRVDNIVRKAKGLEVSQKEAIKKPQEQKILVEDYEETVALIKKGVFPKAPIDSWQCSSDWCGYWNRCRGKE
jgi:hypothetical protein